MRDSEVVFTKEGYEEYRTMVGMLDMAMNFLINNADDLWLGAGAGIEGWSEKTVEEWLYEGDKMIKLLREGPFENYDDD